MFFSSYFWLKLFFIRLKTFAPVHRYTFWVNIHTHTHIISIIFQIEKVKRSRALRRLKARCIECTHRVTYVKITYGSDSRETVSGPQESKHGRVLNTFYCVYRDNITVQNTVIGITSVRFIINIFINDYKLNNIRLFVTLFY